jgi:stage II sporulation protein GA (sporulation sigma-E factor processing peptidase)
VLGGVYAVAVFLPGLGGLSSFPAKAAAGILLGLIAFGGEKCLGRMLLLSFLVSCALAGSVLGLSLLTGFRVPMASGIFYTNVDAPTLLLVSSGAYFVFRIVFRAAARHGMRGEILRVTICIDGRQRTLTALWDSGNSLSDPLDGRPVLVLAPGVVEDLLPGRVGRLLTRKALESPAKLLPILADTAPVLRARLLPYRSVGVAGGMLLAIRCDWAEINGSRYEKLLMALAPHAVGDGYSALWGGEKGKGGRYETLEMVKMLSGKVTPAEGTALHRRK